MNRIARIFGFAFFITLFAISVSVSAHTQHISKFRVSLTIIGSEGIQPIGYLPMPEDSQFLAQREAITYRIHNQSVENSKQFFKTTFPSNGFMLKAEYEGNNWWTGVWKQKMQGGCVQVVAQSVVGVEKTRIQTTPIVC